MTEKSYNFFVSDHETKTVTLTLSHLYNPECKGCRDDLELAKKIAKQLGYQFILKEPKKDHIGISGFVMKNNKGKVEVNPLNL